MDSPDKLGNSTQEQALLRAAARWAVDFAAEALPIFEDHHPGDSRLREAVQAGLAFSHGEKRDKRLRTLAMAAFRMAKDLDEPSNHVALAASLVAAIAYTHTDLRAGTQGVRQARHLLGPVVHAAMALETAANSDPAVGNNIIARAIADAPQEVIMILKYMEPQPQKKSRIDTLFYALDTGLRADVRAS